MQKIKILSLAIIALIFFTLSWRLINQAIFSEQSLTFWVWPILTMMLATVFVSFYIAVSYNFLLFVVFDAVVFAVYLLFFPFDFMVWVGGASFFLLLLLYYNRIRAEEKSRIDFSIRRVFGPSLTVMTYAFLILIGFNIYFDTAQNFRSSPDRFYDRLGQSAARSLELTDTFSVPADIIAQSLTQELRNALSQYEKFFPLIFTLIVVALIRTFGFVFQWLTLLVTWLLFKVLLYSEFFKITKVPVEVDKLEI